MLKIQENKSLKSYNTFGVNVKANYFMSVESEKEILEILQSKRFNSMNKLILGSGSNILFTKNYDGLVIHYVEKGIRVVEENEKYVIIESSAGEIWNDLVSYCVENKYYGIENLSLIPGTVGAAPIQNIGAYGVEIKDVFVSLEGINLESGEKKIYKKNECKFDYRDSIFKRELKGKFIITKVILKLQKEKQFNLNYRSLNDYLGKANKEKLTIRRVRETINKIRMSKLPDPQRFGNAGSFFKNPEVNEEKFLELKRDFEETVFFKLDKNKYKLPAGFLIEKCGYKGKRIGDVATYNRQALVIINMGSATGEQIKTFSQEIQKAVFDKFGIELIPEVNIL
ncbi:MAG: UDP-N-acetylmuramate dehydrogenase [Ignavibacteriales bacterium]|nr:UDP-N-acetylmuramate dehydrogenase [Ignavibacteriales bacterium]